MAERPKFTKKSWRSLVDRADPNRKRPNVIYVFSDGRKFYDRGNVTYKGDK